jgi:hypothetical protein
MYVRGLEIQRNRESFEQKQTVVVDRRQKTLGFQAN